MNLRLWALLVGVAFLSPRALAATGAELVEVRQIWDRAPHNAFTDLIRYDGAWLCVFREGTAHIPGTDGKIRVLRSADGAAWASTALVAEKGVDLRDPKISVAPDGRLMLLMGGSVYAGAEPTPNRKFASAHSRVSFSKDGREWTAPRAVEGVPDNHWLWRVTWHKGVGYGTVYASKGKGDGSGLTIWRTKDGVAYDGAVDPKPPVLPSEATVRFLADETMVVLLRSEEKDRHAWIGTSKAPYEKFEWRDGGRSAGGPDFLVAKEGRMFYGGRDFMEKGAAKTVFGEMAADEGLRPLLTLPSGGDTSYPRLVEAEGGVIWMSYYASHEGKTAIYLAKVRVK
jgi:hypothetical protein